MKHSLSLSLSFWIGLRGNHWQWRMGGFVSSGTITSATGGAGGSGGGGGALILEENEEVKEKEEESEDDMGFSLFD